MLDRSKNNLMPREAWQEIAAVLEWTKDWLVELTSQRTKNQYEVADGYQEAVADSIQQLAVLATEKMRGGEHLHVVGLNQGLTRLSSSNEVVNAIDFGVYSNLASHHLHAYLSMSEDCVWIQDAEFRLTSIAGHIAGELQNQYSLIGKCLWELQSVNVTDADWIDLKNKLIDHEQFQDFEVHLQDNLGKTRYFRLGGMPLITEEGEFSGYRGICTELTWQKEARDRSARAEILDELTGLFNRKKILDCIADARKSCVRDRRASAVLIIDIDNFKDLNDTHGHHLGDELLIQVADRLKSGIRREDLVARLGGDEFLVLLQSIGESYQEALVQADKLARKLAAIIDTSFVLSVGTHHCTSSMGVAIFTSLEESSAEILKKADMAMYQAKSEGRNLIRVFDQTMQVRVNARTHLEQELAMAISDGQLRLFYQPVVDAQNTVIGFEALVRWQHPIRGLVPPNEFIALAEHCGLIIPIGAWVLKTACERLAGWAQNPDKSHLTVAVNLSARQLVQPDMVSTVVQTLALTRAPANRLKLELTESLLLHDIEETIVKMRFLSELGVTFSLDDFGTGYSCLSYLKRLPLSQLKIDQSFVRDLLTDPNDKAIAKAILQLASGLGLTVIAEGVETKGQRDALQLMGCSLFQGYLFGRPLPIVDKDDLHTPQLT